MSVKGGSRCCVKNCFSLSRNNRDLVNQKIGFYKFPNDEALRKEWVGRVQLSFDSANLDGVKSAKRKKFEAKKYSVVCGLHFNTTGKKNYDDKVPIYINGQILSKTIFISNIVTLDTDGICQNIGAETEVSSQSVVEISKSKVPIEKSRQCRQDVHLGKEFV